MIAFIILAVLGGIGLSVFTTIFGWQCISTAMQPLDIAIGLAAWFVLVIYWIGVVNFVLSAS